MVAKKSGSSIRKKAGGKRASKGDKQTLVADSRKPGTAANPDDEDHKTELSDEDPGGQKRIPTMERKVNKKVEAQALVVLDLQTRRQSILDEEVEARGVLTDLMKKADLPEYDLGNDYIVELKQTGELKALVHKKKKVGE